MVRESKVMFLVEIIFRKKIHSGKMRSSEWMRGSDSKWIDSKWIDNPQPSGPRYATVKAAYLYICGKILASLWDAQLIGVRRHMKSPKYLLKPIFVNFRVTLEITTILSMRFVLLEVRQVR